MKCIFFENGNTAFFKDNKQVPELQKSWMIIYLDFLVSKGYDPLQIEFTLPSGKKAEIFKTKDDYNWKIK